MDIDGAKDNLARFKKEYPDVLIYETVTIINEGLKPVLYKISEMLKDLPPFALYDTEKSKEKVVYTYIPEKEFEVFNEGNGVFRIESKKIERLFERTDLKNEESALRFARNLSKMKVDEALKNIGCKNGDMVFIKDYGFEFIDDAD